MMFEKLRIKEQVTWLTELRVGIDYVCKILPCLFPWRIVDKTKIIRNEEKKEKNQNSEKNEY